jgi:chromosome partitioning protein
LHFADPRGIMLAKEMKTTLVINPKGGSGKTTIATNLASCFAAANVPTTLMDYDPQGSSMNWLRLRPPLAAPIHSANAAPERRDRLRSFAAYVPRETRRLVIDAPAGVSGVPLQEMLDRAHCILVPVVPSVIDLHATTNFLRELLAYQRLRSGAVRLAVVANKVRRSMPAYRPLEHFVQSMNLRLLARLIDSDVFLRSAESGVGIFEMDENLSVSERRQFMPILEWVEDRPAAEPQAADRVVYPLQPLGATRIPGLA